MSEGNRPENERGQVLPGSRTPVLDLRTSPVRGVDRGHFGEVVRDSRRKIGMTQEQFAAAIGYSRSAVSRLETSADPNVTPRMLRRIGEVLGVPVARLLGAEDLEDRVNRRQLLQAAGASAFLTPADDDSARVEPRDLVEIERGISDLRMMDQRIGADRLGYFAGRLVADAQRLLRGEYATTSAARVHSVFGEASVLAGWLAQDAGKPQEATRHYSDVITAAHLANDPLLAAHACANLAMLTAVSGQASRAVQCAQAGQRAAAQGGAGPRLRALLFAREATAHAQMGKATSTTEAVRRSHHAFETERGHDPEWVSFLTDTELAGIVGDAYSRLSQHQPALRELGQAGQMAGRPRNAASWRLVLAQAHATAGDPAQAAAIGSDALPAVMELSSTRVRNRVATLVRTLVPHPRVPEVATFVEKARAAGIGA